MAETLRFSVIGAGDASDLDRLAAAVNNISDELKALNRQRAEPTVDVDTRRAEKQVGKFAKDMKRTISRAIESLPEIELDADASEAQREIQEIRSELVALNDKRIGIDIGAEEAQREVATLEARLRALGDADVDIQVRTDAAAAMAQLQAVNAEVDRIDGRRATIKVDVARGSLSSLGGLLKSLTGAKGLVPFATSLMAVGAAATAASASVGGLVAAAASLGGALVATGPILLASAGMIGGVFATLKVGTQGLGMAFKALAEGNMKDWGKALANLSPEAQKFAVAIKDVWTELRQAQGAIQDNLFAGMGEAVSKLARDELPMLKEGMGGVATELNLAAKSVLEYIGSTDGIARQRSMWESTATVVQNLRPWLTNVTAAMFDIGEVGGRVLADITGGAGEAGAGFRKMVADARESGQLEASMRRGVEVLRQLGSIAGNVGSVLGSVFTAARTSGADFLTTLERGTAALAEFMRSGAGQTALVDFFRESRATLDALGAGLVAAGKAAAGFVSAFSNTGGLSAAATGISDLVTAIAPLLPALGELAGNALGLLGSALSVAAAAIGPLVSMLTALLDALGPIGPAVVAMAVAFVGLRAVSGVVAGIGAALAGLGQRITGTKAAAAGLGSTIAEIEGRAAAGERSTSKLSRAFSALGSAVPIAAAALVGVIALYEQAASKADESAKAILNGSMSMQQGIQTEVTQLENRNAAYRAANIEGQEFASVQQNVGASTRGLQTEQSALTEATDAQTRAIQEQYNKLSPFEKLQADVTMATRELKDAIAANDTAGAAAATDRLAQANLRLEQAQDQAGDAAKTHEQRLQELGDTMRSQAGAALSYEQAVLRAAEAQDQANEALKEHGADSTEYKSEVLSLAQAQLAQADAAQAQADALGVSAEEFDAYSTELLRLDTSTQAGKDAFAKIAAGMDDTGRAALSAAARATGLRTEIIKLPNGKTVEVVVEADKGKLDTVKKEAEALARTKWVGTITLDGEPKPFQGKLLQSVKLADGTVAMMTLNADKSPASIVVNGLKYEVDQTTGTLKVLGDVAPGQASLNGFKVVVDQTTGKMQILAGDEQARAVNAALKTSVDTSIGTITINGDPTQANGQTQFAVTFADGSTGTITVAGNPDPATGAITATVQYADGSTGTITVTETGTSSVNSAIDNAARDRTATIRVVQIFEPGAPGRSGGTGLSGGGVIGYSGGGIRGTAARATGGMVVRGYQPGRDTVPAVISRGEAVLVPELVRMLGARRILAANAAASGGREATVIGQLAGMMDGSIGRYAGGGVAAPRMAGGGYSRPMPRWSTSGGGGMDALAREIHALSAELRARGGGKDVNIVNTFAIANASQTADEVSRAQRVAGAMGIFGG